MQLTLTMSAANIKEIDVVLTVIGLSCRVLRLMRMETTPGRGGITEMFSNKPIA